jgi:hypothetical protein
MALIDERGRLLGRINLIDAVAGVLMLALVAGVYVGYRLLRLPSAPIVEKVEPAVQAGGDGRRLSLRGRNFLPFMRVFIQRSGQSAKPLHDVSRLERADEYTLVNFSQAKFLVESPLVAEVRLPDQLGPGTYDLVFYNETQQVAVMPAAFRLTDPPPPPPPPPSAPTANVRLYGAFVAIDRANPPKLGIGTQLPTGAAKPWAEVIEVQAPRPETALVRSPTADFPAQVEGRMQVPAVLRVRCVVVGLFCGIPPGNVAVGTPIPVQVGDRTLTFTVDDIGPDAVDVVRQAMIDVRFFAKPEIARLVRVSDVDRSKSPANARRNGSATMQSRTATQEFTVNVSGSLPDAGQSFQIPDKVVAFNATLSVPLMQLPSGWFYKGQAVKAGATLAFETSDYIIRGMILNITFPDAKLRNRSATP